MIVVAERKMRERERKDRVREMREKEREREREGEREKQSNYITTVIISLQNCLRNKHERSL